MNRAEIPALEFDYSSQNFIETQRAELGHSVEVNRRDKRAPRWLGIATAILALPGGASLIHFINPDIAEAADCKGGLTITARNFKDIGGVEKQYDSKIDQAGSVIPNTIIKLTVNNKPIINPEGVVRTDANGRIVTPAFNAECSTDPKFPNKIEVVAQATTPDKRYVSETLVAQNGRGDAFTLWVDDGQSVFASRPGVPERPQQVPPTPDRPAPQPAQPSQPSGPAGGAGLSNQELEGLKKLLEDSNKKLEESTNRINELEEAEKRRAGQGFTLPSLPSNFPIVETLAGILGLGVLSSLLLNRPGQYRTRVWNAAAWPIRDRRYRRGPLAAHEAGLADGTIAAGTPAPARTFPRAWAI